jgi:hypothetical protein
MVQDMGPKHTAANKQIHVNNKISLVCIWSIYVEVKPPNMNRAVSLLLKLFTKRTQDNDDIVLVNINSIPWMVQFSVRESPTTDHTNDLKMW